MSYKMQHLLRTTDCGSLRKEQIGEEVTLTGWVHRRRDHGGVIFIDLRDRFGLTQIVFRPDQQTDLHEQASALRSEWVIGVKGKVIARAPGMTNPHLSTGEIEIDASTLTIYSMAKTTPFSIAEENEVNEELRLKYRYLDMRRGTILERLVIRHKMSLFIRNFLSGAGFVEVATPLLARSTPEGARDYLVPSRVYPGSFYALPQSPQIFKQLLMIGGLDRYFQIASCFRDEDLRADRQPEFTQLDIEISFGTMEALFDVIEELMVRLLQETKGIEVPRPFLRMSHKEALSRYGTDKPDLRFGMPLVDISDIAKDSQFSVFLDVLASEGIVKGLNVKGGAESVSRKKIEEYTAFVSHFHAKGLAWIKVTSEGMHSTIVKFFNEETLQKLATAMDAKEGDLLLFVADREAVTNQALDHLRRKIGKELGLIDESAYALAWVTDFPLLEYDKESGRYICAHHPFTTPHPEDFELLDSNPTKARSIAYDLVLNGFELGSGSERIFDNRLQKKIFSLIKMSDEEIKNRFGFFIEALQYGTPPHMGIALGLDRLAMLLSNASGIRDVIAFPKTQKAFDLMSEAPSHVMEEQLTELKIHIEVK